MCRFLFLLNIACLSQGSGMLPMDEGKKSGHRIYLLSTNSQDEVMATSNDPVSKRRSRTPRMSLRATKHSAVSTDFGPMLSLKSAGSSNNGEKKRTRIQERCGEALTKITKLNEFHDYFRALY